MGILTDKLIFGGVNTTTPYVNSIETDIDSASTDLQIPTAKAVYDAIAAIPAYAGPTVLSSTVSTSGWTLTGGYYRKTITGLTGVTSTNTIVVSPRNVRTEYNEYIDKKIMVYSQSTGSIVLEATSIPITSIVINIIIF